MNAPFDFANRISDEDQAIAVQYIGSIYTPPDLIIAPAGTGEYLFRWYVVPRNNHGNVYFHIQTASDPERPLHDHPWDNTSVLLAGAYQEIWDARPERNEQPTVKWREAGDVVHRAAEVAHRLILPHGVPYMMSVFTTGPKRRKWGFWEAGVFRPYEDVTVESDGKSSWKGNMA